MKVKIRGKRRLQGTVEISGAKNSAVAIIPAAVLADEPLTIRNIPDIQDVRTLIAILQEIGYSVSFRDNILRIKQLTKIDPDIGSEEVKKLRGSYYFMGAFLGKLKKVKIYASGGVQSRPPTNQFPSRRFPETRSKCCVRRGADCAQRPEIERRFDSFGFSFRGCDHQPDARCGESTGRDRNQQCRH